MNTFEKHIAVRTLQQKEFVSKYGLNTIELNPTELCNRTCSFCPRAIGYPNQNLHLTLDNALLLKEKLLEFDYKGIIVISGYGEPLLNNNILQIINILSSWWTELISNGDKILDSTYKINDFFSNGLSRIILDEYDSIENFHYKKKLLKNFNGIVKNHLVADQNYNNRSNYFKTITTSISKPCYIPFYKTFVDYNLEVRFCPNDWNHKVSIGNLHNDSLENIWLSSKMQQFRNELIQGHRKNIKSCKFCDAIGTLVGINSFNYFKNNA